MDLCEREGCSNPRSGPPANGGRTPKFCSNYCRARVAHQRARARKHGYDTPDGEQFTTRLYEPIAQAGEPITRRCRNKHCVIRFVPVNSNHWYHEPACAQSTDLYTVEEILAEEASVHPETNPLEIAKIAFGQKNQVQRKVDRISNFQTYLSFDVRTMFEEQPELRFPASTYTPPAKAGTKGEREILVVLSDWQVGKLENGIGVDVMEHSRIPRILSAVRSIVDHYRDSGYTIKRGVAALVGDMAEGCWIYGGQQAYGLDRTGGHSMVTRQILKVAHLESTVAVDMATYLEEVDVHSVGGNHGRPNAKHEYAELPDNYDLLASTIASYITQNTKNVKWTNHNEFWGGFHVAGHYVVAQHGDQWRGDLSKFNQLLPQYLTSDVYRGRPSLVLLGHRHDYAHFRVGGIDVIQNGTIDGGSNWYLRAFGKASKPEQTVVVMSERFGVEAVYPIYFPPPEASLLVAS